MRNGLAHKSIFSSFYSGNMLLSYSIIGSYSGMFPRVCANFFNLFCGKSAIVMLLTMLYSSLVFCIKTVLQLRVWCQMPRIYTTRIIAGVHKNKSIWNFSPEKFICVTMGINTFSIERYHSVSSLSLCCQPQPTRVSFLNAIHKRFVRADRRKVIKLSCIPNSIVAIPAQSSTVMWFSTLHTWRLDSLVSHISPCRYDYNINKEYCNE